MIEAERYVSLDSPLPGDVQARGKFTGTESERVESKWPVRFTTTRLTVIKWLDHSTHKTEAKFVGNGIVIPYWLVTLPIFFLTEYLLRGKVKQSPPNPTVDASAKSAS